MYSRWMANLVQSFAQAGMLPRCAGWMVAEQSTHVPYPVCSTPAEEVRMDQDRSWKLGRWFGSGRCSEICEIDGRLRTDRYTRVPVGVSARGQYQGKMNVWCYIHLCERTAGGCVEYHPTCQTNSRGMWIIEINALLVTSIIVDSVPARARAWGGRSRCKKATLGTGCAQEGKGKT